MTQVRLKLIVDNPYQPRTADDAEHIEKLARSIAVDGLLQMPTARRVNGHFELAFGHSRRKAFEWLMENWQKQELPERYDGYKVMPLNEAELNDAEMFRYAVTENVQRKDLSPTELAKSLKQYMEISGANSKQAGELFGMNEATVRGMVRLLDLPTAAQEALDAGKISQGTARTILSVQKLASEAVITDTIKEIEKKETSMLPDEVIEHMVDQLDNVVEMWNDHHRDGKPRAGYQGWLLDMKNFPNRQLPMLTGHTAVQALDCFNNKPAQKLVLEWAEYFAAESMTSEDETFDQGMYDAIKGQAQQKLNELSALNHLYAERLQHLVNPPTCTACPFYSKINGTHYCGVKQCHERKTTAWRAWKVEQASKNLGIPMYTEADGRFTLLLSYEDKHKKLFEKRDANLRLITKDKVSGYHYQQFKGVEDDIFCVVAVGDSIDKLGTTKGTSGGKKTEKEKAEMRAMKIYRIRRKEMMWECTGLGQAMFESVPEKLIERLRRWHYVGIDDSIPDAYKSGNEKGVYPRRALVWALIHDESSHFSRSTMAAIVKGFQERTGVKPTKTILKLAEQWDAEIDAAAKAVAVETKKGKKG